MRCAWRYFDGDRRNESEVFIQAKGTQTSCRLGLHFLPLLSLSINLTFYTESPLVHVSSPSYNVF